MTRPSTESKPKNTAGQWFLLVWLILELIALCVIGTLYVTGIIGVGPVLVFALVHYVVNHRIEIAAANKVKARVTAVEQWSIAAEKKLAEQVAATRAHQRNPLGHFSGNVT